jgi:hypothetical protein
MYSNNKPKQTYVLSEIIKEQQKYKNNPTPRMVKDILNISHIDNMKIELNK